MSDERRCVVCDRDIGVGLLCAKCNVELDIRRARLDDMSKISRRDFDEDPRDYNDARRDARHIGDHRE